MPAWLRRGGGALLVLLFLAYAYAPVVTAGLTGGEFHTLVDVDRVLHPPAETSLAERAGWLFEVHGAPRRPLAALSLVVSRLLQPGPVDAAALVTLRVENLVLLLLAALAFGAFVRRVLMSWTGSDQATAAGRASALLIALQPLHGSAVASVEARGDLLALLLGGLAGTLFLKGRQERRYALTVVAALLGLLAGASSGIALALPALVAVAEYTSARRYRPAHVRLRTAGTTLLVSGACVLLAPVLGKLMGFTAPALRLRGGLAEQVTVGLERLGALVLPINAAASGALGFALAGAVVLLALQPAFVAARSAPRLWGWMLAGWVLMTLLSELFSPPVRVHPEDVTRAATLLPASVAASVGLAVAATAISGLRRALLPLALGAAWALLAHQGGSAWNRSARAIEVFRGDLVAARERWSGADARLLAVDPPRRVGGVDAVQGALPWMLDPIFATRVEPRPGAARGGAIKVRAVSRDGLAAYAREAKFEGLRSDPLIVVLPPDSLESAPLAGAGPEAQPDGGDRLAGLDGTGEAGTGAVTGPLSGDGVWSAGRLPGGRVSRRLEPVEAFRLQRSYYGPEGRLDLDGPTVGARALVATVRGEATPDLPPRLGWRASGGATGELVGAWVAGDDGTQAVFDLCASTEWVLADRVKVLYSEHGWGSIRDAVLLDSLPEADVEGPRVKRADWEFRVQEPEAGTVWRLELIEFSELAYRELRVIEDEDGRLRVPGAERAVAELTRGERGPVAWSLLRLEGEVAVGRLAGRRE